MKFYKVMMLTFLLYSSECWTLTEQQLVVTGKCASRGQVNKSEAKHINLTPKIK
jgi:hypothetical protein